MHTPTPTLEALVRRIQDNRIGRRRALWRQGAITTVLRGCTPSSITGHSSQCTDGRRPAWGRLL